VCIGSYSKAGIEVLGFAADRFSLAALSFKDAPECFFPGFALGFDRDHTPDFRSDESASARS
jgi:hypothetical protein